MNYWTDIFFCLHIFKGGVTYIWVTGDNISALSAVADLDGYPFFNLPQLQSKSINIVVLTICHIKQL